MLYMLRPINYKLKEEQNYVQFNSNFCAYYGITYSSYRLFYWNKA